MNWWDYPVGRSHDANDNASGGELGIDLSTPNNTPITCPWPASVTYVGNSSSTGWIVKALTSIPGYGGIYVYFLHLNSVSVTTGQQLAAGALVGLSGGLQPGAGGWAHVEFGAFHDAAYAQRYWGFVTGSTIDPTPIITALRNGESNVSAPSGLGAGFAAMYVHMSMKAAVTVPEVYFNDHESLAVFADGTVFYYNKNTGELSADTSRGPRAPYLVNALVIAWQTAKSATPAPAPVDPTIAAKAAKYDAIKAALGI